MKKISSSKLARLVNGTTAVAFGLGLAAPALLASPVASAAELEPRSIQMSSAAPSATGVSYKVTFTPGTTESGGVVYVDFCSNSPLEGDTCTATGGTNVPDLSSVAGPATTTGVSDGTTTHTAKITGQTLTDGTPYTAELTGITNPSTTSSFYARVYTYASAGTYTPSASATPTDTGYVDFGGVALSTANAVNITARVQETLQFCVLNVTPTAACANALAGTEPDITLGHGVNNVLDGSAVDTAQVYSQLSTNAYNGAVIDAHLNNAACTVPGHVGVLGGLSADGDVTCSIGPVGDGGNTATTIDPGNTGSKAVFGMNVTDGTGDIGSTTASAPYNTVSKYGMDTTTSDPSNVIGTYGGVVASSAGPTSNVNNTYTFAATAVPTTPAGIYTGEVSLIATGTF